MLYKITQQVTSRTLTNERAEKLGYKKTSWLQRGGDSWVLPEKMCPAFVKILEFGFNSERGKPELTDYWVVISDNTHIPKDTICSIEVFN